MLLSLMTNGSATLKIKRGLEFYGGLSLTLFAVAFLTANATQVWEHRPIPSDPSSVWINWYVWDVGLQFVATAFLIWAFFQAAPFAKESLLRVLGGETEKTKKSEERQTNDKEKLLSLKGVLSSLALIAKAEEWDIPTQTNIRAKIREGLTVLER